MFGHNANPSFRGFNTVTQNSPFGQSAFGKPITTMSFGSTAAPVFGSTNTSLFNSKPAGTTTGLFGNNTTTPAFGQPTTTTFGGFGTTNTSTNLFGAQPNASTSLFGTSTTTPAFGQANKPAGFGFGSTTGTNLFGQPQQPAQQTTPFGQTNATNNTNLFGTTGGFGTSTANTAITGTVIKFNPVTGNDTMVKNGVAQPISIRHHCITCMKEYEGKSLEELRLEDYQAGRKGVAQGQTPGLFGTAAQPSPFGTPTAGTSTAATGFGVMSGGFGTTSQAGTTSLFGKPMPTFGAPTTTTNGFAFNSTPSTNLFGTNTQAKPFGTTPSTTLFPAANTSQPAATGFGGLNTTQNTGFGTTFGTTQPNQSIGLFNQNKPAFNIPSSSAATGFSTFGQTTTNNTGSSLFAKPAGTTGFGATPTFGTTTSTTFGTNTGFTAGQNTGTSLFNSACKPAGQNPNFPFGDTSAFSGPRLNTTPQSNLFMQPKSGGLFGTTGTNTTFNTPGTFGTTSAFGTNTNMGTGLGMGLLGGGTTTTPAQNSGVVPVHQQILALVSAPFGDSPLLKNLLPASGKADELLKPANAASRMLNSPQYKVTANNKSPKVKPRVVSAAQLSKKSLFEGLEEEDPALSEAFQPRSNAKRLVLRPKSLTNSSIQSLNENSHSDVENLTRDENNVETSNTESRGIETNDKENLNQENSSLSGNDRRVSSFWLKTNIPRKNKLSDSDLIFDGQKSPFTGSEDIYKDANNTVAELHGKVSSQSSLNKEYNANESALNSSSAAVQTSIDLTLGNSDSSRELEESSLSPLQANWNQNWEQNAAKVTLRRAGYYTIPPLNKLGDYVQGETCIVPNFTIGREGYGNVYFEDSFDIYGLNLDEIVHFRHKEVIIYPDDEKKPPVGQGLNRKAQVTLDRVWPHDKSLHEPITDPSRLAAMNYEGKLRRVSAKHDTRFLEYRPETGSWVFKVDHFSKYGLSDSDEEDNYPQSTDPKKVKKNIEVLQQQQQQQQSGNNLEQAKLITADGMTQTIMKTLEGDINKYSDIGSDMFKDNSINGSSISTDYSSEKDMAPSPTATYARLIGTDSHKLQLMKASFFDEFDEDTNEDMICDDSMPRPHKNYSINGEKVRNQHLNTSSILTPILHTNLKIQQLPLMANEEKSYKSDIREKPRVEVLKERKVASSLVVKPVTAVLKSRSELVPLQKSIINKLKFRCVADTGIQMGRMFRPSWGPGLTLLSLSTQAQASKVLLRNSFSQLGSYVSGRLLGDSSSTTIVQRLQVLGGHSADEEQIQIFKESIEGHLRIQLEHCIMGQEGDCPTIEVSSESKNMALLAHCTLAQEFANQHEGDRFAEYTSNIWKLCMALWGDLHCTNGDGDETGHRNVMLRREALGEWFKNVVKDAAQREFSENKNDNQKMLTLLTAYQLNEACELARSIGNHCLALLMAQLQSGMPVRELIKQQLALWQEMDVDENLTVDHLKLFMLVAGEPLISSKHGTINICNGLDWKRAFAMHLWYLSSPVASITDIVEQYEVAFNAPETEMYAALPAPEYKESDYDAELSNNKPIHDLCFHLLKLYTTGNHSLEELLNPLTHTADPLDYRLSWLMQQTLISLGYQHLSKHVAELTHVNFATQLEAYGLWHWAIFVVLQLKNTSRRRAAVMNLLERYVEIDDIPDYVKREEFLKEELGISSMWINQAKALKSRVAKRYGEAAWYFIQAEEWNLAHDIIIDHLAADAIINEHYDYLKSLLSPMVPAERSRVINGWPNQGQLLWDYMEINNEIKALSCTSDTRGLTYKLEMLKPQLTSLCLKINQFPCPTAKHRLCQAEIAKRSVHMTRSLLMLQSSERNATATILVNLISQLPLPEDYTQQELRPIMNICVREIMSQSV